MANVDVELGDVDIIQDTVQSLLDCVEKEQNHTNHFLPSIYMAPSNLRDRSPNSFNPRVVSIGPLHREDDNVQAIEGRKATYLIGLLRRLNSPQEETMKACVQKVNASINGIKACYAGMKTYGDVELAKMMVMDGCFILEFIYRISKREKSILGNMLPDQSIIYDLVLLENQIPFFVLKDIFECTILKFEPTTSLTNLILPVLETVNLFKANLIIGNIGTDTTHHHILGLLHECYQPRDAASSVFSRSTIPSAIELDMEGVNFKPNRDAKSPMELKLSRFSCFSYSWGKPTLRMPVLHIHDFTELVLRNLIAYEQCFLGHNYVKSYALTMNMLIDTEEDIAKLVESKVLVNHIGSNEEAANMMNKICK